MDQGRILLCKTSDGHVELPLQQLAPLEICMDSTRIELVSPQLAPLDIAMDLARIELAFPQCECGVVPLDHRPFVSMSNGVNMRRITTILRALNF